LSATVFGTFVIPDQFRKEIALLAKRLSPRRGYLKHPGGPEFIHGNQVLTVIRTTPVPRFPGGI